MKMSNQNYDVGKWLVLIFLPAFAVFINGMGDLYQWIDTSTVVTTINLMAVFIGSVLQISSQNYKDSDDSYGGGTHGTNCS